jgi:hypothetical protein
MSVKSTSGFSYRSHITFAASMGEPPPRAMMVSGRNERISSAPLSTVDIVGSGSTVSRICTVTLFGRWRSTARIRST